MSKTKSVWESRFYILKYRLKMHMEFVNQKLAKESIDAKGKATNTVDYWESVGRYVELKDLIRQSEYIETQIYF